MTEKITLPGVADDTNALINGLLDDLDRKTPRNLLRSSYYDGRRAIRQVSSVIPPQYYRLGIVLGWSAKAVDLLARRCNLDGLVMPDGDPEALGVSDMMDELHFRQRISSGIVSSLLYGPAFLISTQGVGDEPTSLLHVKDATSATGEWDSRLWRLRNLLSITRRDADGQPTALALYQHNTTMTAEKDSSGWQVDHHEHSWGLPVEVMAWKPSEDRPFGRSRITRPIMGIQDEAARTIIRMEGHADVFSFPELWLLGADNSIFKNGDGSMKAEWQVMLGRIKGVPDMDGADVPRADVKQFQAASPMPHIEQHKQQAQRFAGESSIPLTSLGVSDMSNPTSSDSYMASREDLVAEAEGGTDDWSPAIRRTAARQLAMRQGLASVPPEWKSLDCNWRSPVYTSRAAQADAGQKQLAAVPWLADTAVGLELLGLTRQQADRALGERRRAQAAQALAALGVERDDAQAG